MIGNSAVTDFPNDEYIIIESPESRRNGNIIDLNNLPKVSFAFQH